MLTNSFKITNFTKNSLTKRNIFTKSEDFQKAYTDGGVSRQSREEWSEILQGYRYNVSQNRCNDYWRFDIDRSFDIQDFERVYSYHTPKFNHGYVVGEKCPQIDLLYTPNQCRDFYHILEYDYFTSKCLSLGDKTIVNDGSELQAVFSVSNTLSKIYSEFFNESNFFLLNYKTYELWFSIKKPILLEEYYQIGIFASFAVFLAALIISASYALVTQNPESEKLSTYECGFEPYEDAKNKFDVHFYIIAILFVLFDIEILVVLPGCLSLSSLNLLGYWTIIEFLLELGLGFVYVWCVNALDW